MLNFLKNEMDMTTGNLLKKILIFSIPLFLTTILQLLYTSADLIVIAQFRGYNSMNAVGSTGSLVNLIVNLFLGLSTGANVTIAQAIGAKNKEKSLKLAHNAILISIISGFVVGIIGVFFCGYFLELMGTPTNVIAKATTYLTIYFIGAPFLMIFNFGASILRAIGDTVKPLIFLMISGFTNVGLNFVFVLGLNMDVEGVAYATIISEAVSAILVIWALMRKKDDSFVKLSLKSLKFSLTEVKDIIRVGLPSGLQNSIFSISNVLISSSINSFGEIALGGNVAAGNIEGYVYAFIAAIPQTTIAFASQNYGAKNKENMKKIFKFSLIIVVLGTLITGGLVLLLNEPLLRIFCTEEAMIPFGRSRLFIICSTYFLCGIMDVCAGYQRGLNQAITPTVITFICATLLRVVFIVTLFKYVPFFHTLDWIMLLYPITWALASVIHLLAIFKQQKKVFAQFDKYHQDLVIQTNGNNININSSIVYGACSKDEK